MSLQQDQPGGAAAAHTAVTQAQKIPPPARDSIRSARILADTRKAPVRGLLKQLSEYLESRGLSVAIDEDIYAFCQAQEERLESAQELEAPGLLVVMGGDGAMLGAVRAYRHTPVPTLGINFGRVGFLASTAASHWRETLAGVLDGHGNVEPRMRITGALQRSKSSSSSSRSNGNGRRRSLVALNDIVLSRSSHQGILTVSLAVDGSWVTDYRADGLITATPSGSTAYSLSAGGPILVPHMDALVMTPICSHGLANRPIVLDPSSRLSITVTRCTGLTTLVVDGQDYIPVEEGDTLEIRRHPKPYPLLVMPGLDPYRRLRERLGWSGSVKADSEGSPS